MGVRKITTTVSDNLYKELETLKQQGYKINDLLKYAVEAFKSREEADRLYKKALADLKEVADISKSLSLFANDYKANLERLRDVVVLITNVSKDIDSVVKELKDFRQTIISLSLELSRKLEEIKKTKEKIKRLNDLWFSEFYNTLLKREDLPVSLKTEIANLYRSLVERLKKDFPELFEE